MDGKDFREQHSKNDILPRAPLRNMVVWDTTVVPQLFREQLSEKKASIAETSSRQRYVNCQLPCGPRCPTGQEDCRETLSAKISSFFQKYLASYLKLLLINVTSGTTCQLERTHKKIGCCICFAESDSRQSTQ